MQVVAKVKVLVKVLVIQDKKGFLELDTLLLCETLKEKK